MINVQPDIKPFQVKVADETLEDLRNRLERARYPPNDIHRDKDGWSYGTNMVVLKDLVDYWKTTFLPNWRDHEARINEMKMFTANVNGRRLHFVHELSNKPDAVPLIISHGWPSTVWDFHKIIPMLVEQGFHVVAPSLPGYAWSEAANEPGCDVSQIANTFDKLMSILGYEWYIAQGGDWGAIIVRLMATMHPKRCIAMHTNMPYALPPSIKDGIGGISGLAWFTLSFMFQKLAFTKKERQNLKETMHFQKYETAYQKIQGTKPQTLGYGLTDSPIGLCAWILEKLHRWSDCGSDKGSGSYNNGGNVEERFKKDEILTTVMIYWITQSITSSMRIYYEVLRLSPFFKSGFASLPYCETPTACVTFKCELFKPPRSWADLNYNVVHWSTYTTGGHFASVEEPKLLMADIVKFVFVSLGDLNERIKEAKQRTPGGGKCPGNLKGKLFLFFFIGIVLSIGVKILF